MYPRSGFRSGRTFNPRTTFPKGPKIEKNQDLEIFKRDWKFQARHPPHPHFLWGILEVRIEIFKPDWNFQARLKISTEIEFFQSLGPLGWGFFRHLFWHSAWEDLFQTSSGFRAQRASGLLEMAIAIVIWENGSRRRAELTGPGYLPNTVWFFNSKCRGHSADPQHTL